ncbi:uncharacterized protein LOC101744688 [Bombyx mori]|uniref:C2H2-type domain-containing protein n=1 Tax=Bombyx mori TaxID=7091 RepID=A0A8R2CA55_BOMMO|nr:uncharacterized protein LOC101744688 [Bombyx mori]
MIANLPLLFANGNPIPLSKIRAGELERFITFMVTCSWGHDTAKDIRQPPWWPSNVEFTHPFVRPAAVPNDWELRLKNVVKKCYEYHKSAFLLVFSAQLSRYPRNRLLYVDNKDHTTSLYYIPSNRLLVTFRNENINYDKDVQIEDEEPVVRAADIYLCDNCDSHFDNLNNLQVHERLCHGDNSPAGTSGGLPEFLAALKLKQATDVQCSGSEHIEYEARPKNARNAANIDRGPPYPFSSLAYIKNAKTLVQRDTSYSRERIERYCCTSTPLSKNVVSKNKHQQFPVRYKRPIDYWHRKHVFPDQRNKDILDLKAQLCLLKCRVLTVNVERMSEEKIEDYIQQCKNKLESELQQKQEKDVIFVDNIDTDQGEDEETKIADPLRRSEVECEVIDLCSDDESSSSNENCDPRAGVACVMRGGAILRRAAASTPQALPADPCGARHLPAVLQPHPNPQPIILIAHTFNNLQTISLE